MSLNDGIIPTREISIYGVKTPFCLSGSQYAENAQVKWVELGGPVGREMVGALRAQEI